MNDLIRAQMNTLLARKELSKSDKDRLDLHFTSIRDLEISMSAKLPDTEIKDGRTIDKLHQLAARIRELETIVRRQRRLLILLSVLLMSVISLLATLYRLVPV